MPPTPCHLMSARQRHRWGLPSQGTGRVTLFRVDRNRHNVWKKSKPTANSAANGTARILSYLPDGWKFAIVTIEPPKRYKNTRNQEMRQSSAGWPQLGQGTCGFVRKSSLGRSDGTAVPSDPLTWPCLGSKAGQDCLGKALIPSPWAPITASP